MNKKSVYTLLLLTLPTLIMLAALLILMSWHIPTHIQVNLTVDRAVFTVGGNDPNLIMNGIKFQSITVESFARITLDPSKWEIADPAKYIPAEDRYQESAWKALTFTSPVVITSKDGTLQSTVTFEATESGLRGAGCLDQVAVWPGTEVTIEVRGHRILNPTIKVEGRQSTAKLCFRGKLELITEYGQITGLTGLPALVNSLTHRVQLPDHSPFIEITGMSDLLMLILTISPKEATDLFTSDTIVVKAIDFTRMDKTGKRLSTLVKDKTAVLAYSDYPKIEKVILKAPNFIGLDRLKKFRIEKITIDPEYGGMQFRLNGVAGYVSTGSHDFTQDHRLSIFDTLWQNPRFMILLGIIAWVFPTTVGGYKLYKEVKT